MDWEGLYKLIHERNKTQEVLRVLQSNGTFNMESVEISVLPGNTTEGKVYDFKHKVMYRVSFNDDVISVGKHFLINCFQSQLRKVEISKNAVSPVTFYDHQFLINMYMATDVSSGFSWSRNSVKEIASSLEIGDVSLDGFLIKDEEHLNDYLSKNIHGFETLFGSVERIKGYS